MLPNRFDRLAELTADVDVLFCDVWGVIHNGVEVRPSACEALAACRVGGGSVVLVTNSPRLNGAVTSQLDRLGVPRQAYDRVVTSGDVTRGLIGAHGPNVCFIGPDRDRALLAGLDVRGSGPDEAAAVVCSGLVDDESETPQHYRPLLETCLRRNLPFICVNPDIAVERGSRLVPCAGAVAALYTAMGGRTLVAGKPHRPIYAAALAMAQALRGPVETARVLAIGDGLATDIKGAQDFGVDCLYIADGIHAGEYTRAADGGIDEDRLAAFLERNGARPAGWMRQLR